MSNHTKQRIAFTLQVKPGKLEEYKKSHAQVWPEMLEALRLTGWTNYSLFLRPDGLLIGYLETEDFDAALQGMALREVNARWQAEMVDLFDFSDGKRPDERMFPIEEVFHLD